MARNKKRSQAQDENDPDTNQHPNSMAAFRTRLEAGDYDAIIGRKLRRTLRDAAVDTGLDAEIGSLRLTLIRLLQEEHDPSRLATGVSRIAGIAVQAARLRQGHDGDAEKIGAFLQRELAAIEAERIEKGKGSNEATGDETG